jgi:hypothetical protein
MSIPKHLADVYADKHCACGHRIKWYVEGEPETGIFGDLAREAGIPDNLHLESDVVERDCPHRNGTTIDHCPKCDRKVGMWGCGVAGGMECDCWGEP